MKVTVQGRVFDIEFARVTPRFGTSAKTSKAWVGLAVDAKIDGKLYQDLLFANADKSISEEDNILNKMTSAR